MGSILCSRRKISDTQASIAQHEPKVRPPMKHKNDLVPDVNVFNDIDDHAAKVKAPKSAITSVKTLSKYLCQVTKNDLEKVRVFFKWIQLNISYDVAGLNRGDVISGNPEDVLNSGLAVCAGYANLFEELCKEAGIRCKSISGYSKGYNYNPENPFSLKQKTNHAWNAVFLSGQWNFVECIWGTGCRDGTQFVRRNEEFWFLTHPEHFSYTHFPYMDKDIKLSERWQLIQKPKSLKTFNKTANFKPLSFEYNLEFSHTDFVLHMQKQVEITVRSPSIKLESFHASLREKNGHVCSKYVMTELTDVNKYVITVKPPSKSTYKLTLWAKSKNCTDNLVHQLVTFTIKCNKALEDVKPYPELNGVWGAAADITEYGFEESACSKFHYLVDTGETDITLPFLKGVNPNVKLKIEHAEEVINDINSYTMATARTDSLVAKVILPATGFYKLEVYSKPIHSPSENCKLDLIMNLLLECTKPAIPCHAFPHVYPLALEYQVELVETLTRDLHADKETKFKLRPSELQRVLCNEKVVEKPASDKWQFSIRTPQSGEDFCIYGTTKPTGSFDGLFKFTII